jgi:hypothetical protein
MRTVQDANDAALGTLGARDAAPPLDLRQNVVSVHGVFDGIPGDVYIAIQLGHGCIRHHEAVAVRVKDQATLQFVTIYRSDGRLRPLWSRRVLGLLPEVPDFVRLPPRKAIAFPGQLFDSPTLLEFREQLEQRSCVRVPEA